MNEDYDMTRAILNATERRQLSIERFAAFGRDVLEWIIANDFWSDDAGDDFMPMAEKRGLAQRAPYDPEIHGNEIDAEAGDMIWFIDAAKLNSDEQPAGDLALDDLDTWLGELHNTTHIWLLNVGESRETDHAAMMNAERRVRNIVYSLRAALDECKRYEQIAIDNAHTKDAVMKAKQDEIVKLRAEHDELHDALLSMATGWRNLANGLSRDADTPYYNGMIEKLRQCANDLARTWDAATTAREANDASARA